MKNRIYIIAALLLATIACENIDVLENEQYIKQVYIVGAADVVWPFDVTYSNEPQEAYISVATSGSKYIDEDVTVTLRHNDPTIAWYNNKYLYDAPVKYQKLDPAKFSVASFQTTIKAGEVYARLPFTIQTSGLHCDSLYAVTFAIESVSRYEKNIVDTALILNLNLVNEFSGTYQFAATRYSLVFDNSTGGYIQNPNGTYSTTRTLKAVDANSVRFFNEARAEVRGGYASNEAYFTAMHNYCVKFTRVSGNSFNVESWGALVIHEGECSYNEATSTFTFRYDYQDGNTRYRIEGTLTK
ncbi:MAG: DUF4361 domain-containing protein [Odoribacteraceae bacterium]|jgi:hypothetical protein|nr:DUF4361 domain-containing protein [Odoribacteraceae bacterium]